MHEIGRRSAWLLVLACAIVLSPPGVYAEEAPTSVVDWLRARGEDVSFEARQERFRTFFPGEAYGGTADQNVRLLDALQGRPTATAPTGPSGLRTASTREVTGHGWRAILDRSAQVLNLDVPEEVVWEREAGRREEPVLPALPFSAQGGLFVSAAVLGVKAKIFDDGLYAAVEVATQRGYGDFPGRAHLLDRVRKALLENEADDRGAAVVCAARDYGTGRHGDPLPEPLRARVAREKRAFEGNALRSKPIGFYTWSEDLARIFRQDRMLQTPLATKADVETVARALRADPSKEASYRRMLRLASRLTNPLVRPHVLAPPTARGPSRENPYHLLPPSRSHEVDLAQRLWGRVSVPEGAVLFDELIPRVRDGSLSLAPREDSGWYDHVTWALEPLLRPDAQPEAARLSFTKGYRAHLEELFKGLLALTRETHVKQLEIGMCGACMPRPTIHVAPGLTLEPLATHYRRRADAYRFVRDVLEEAFGRGGLRSLRRLTIDGPVDIDLDSELDLMTRIFDGAAETALDEIGSPDADRTAKGEVARAVFRTWHVLATSDPDLAQDVRMLVPVFYDVEREQTKVWVFLGWQERPLTISYEKPPRLASLARVDRGVAPRPEVEFGLQNVRIAYPVVAEVYVTELLDRRAMRAHCDRHRTRSAILGALR